MKKGIFVFVFLGVFFVNSSYSMVKTGGDSKESNFISLINNFFISLLNLASEDKNSLENFLKEEGFWNDFCKDFRAEVFFKDPFAWKMDR